MSEQNNEPQHKTVEIVKMEDDRSLSVSHVSTSKDMSPGISMWNSTESDADYAELIARHGITKPGQQSVFTREFRNGSWIEKLEREGNW